MSICSPKLKGFQKGHQVRLGMKHSEETKAKIGAKSKGRVSSMKGRKMTSSAKALISTARKGKPIHATRGSNQNKPMTAKEAAYRTKKGIAHLQKKISPVLRKVHKEIFGGIIMRLKKIT